MATDRGVPPATERRRPGHGHPRTIRRRSPDLPAAARRPDDGVRDREAEACAGRTLDCTVEPVEDPLALVIGDPRTAVVDRQADLAAVSRNRDPDDSPIRRVFAGVVEED